MPSELPHAAIARALCAWFPAHARDLPWRTTSPATGRRDPYAVLVSEVMLQQTQVSRVIESYNRFLSLFPTPAALARAPIQRVLHAWQGLGYYRRAALLHQAAIAIQRDHAGTVPRDPDHLRALPGVGEYTHGAIASLAFGEARPIVDTNVARVLLRVAGKEMTTKQASAQRWTWSHAQKLVDAAPDPGVCNESLMELGALVCTPRAPACTACPLAGMCAAHRTGKAESIPLVAQKPVRVPIIHSVLLVRDDNGRVLVQQRDAKTGRTNDPKASPSGMWKGMWQALTSETEPRAKPIAPRALARSLGLPEMPLPRPRCFTFLATHRRVRFRVYEVVWNGKAPKGARWASRSQLARLPLSAPQRRILLGGSPRRKQRKPT